MMAPVFEQAAARLEPNLRLAKVNTEAEQQLAAQYNIRSIPTLAVFKHGQEIARSAGAMDLNNLLNWAEQFKLR
jgi:thioredoxin 2